MSAFQPESSAYAERHIGASDSASVVEFRQNYGDIDSAVNDLLIPQKNTSNAVQSFLTMVEADLKKNNLFFQSDKGCFSSPLENSYRSDILMIFGGVALAKITFSCKGRELQEIHAKRGAALSPRSYPVEMTIRIRTAAELAYEFGLDMRKDARGLTAVTRPFKHMIEGQPYRFAFDENGNLNKSESQINRVHDHFNIMTAQLLFAVRQLGIEKREPSFTVNEDGIPEILSETK